MAHDERSWELICTRHYQRSPMQLHAVVSTLGGFRRLYSSHLWPLLKPASPAPPTVFTWPYLPPAPAPLPGAVRSRARWGKDTLEDGRSRGYSALVCDNGTGIVKVELSAAKNLIGRSKRMGGNNLYGK